MNEREEAIKYLADKERALRCALPHAKDGWFEETVKEIQALDMAIEALEKQIPQKPSWEYLGDNLSRKEIITLCPCCYESIEEGEHHCKCGQVIDWSDGE